MNGYKTGGDWTDVTSIGRNEVVFEGRHKAYGAYYIRQCYPNALLFALLSAITFVALCAAIPMAFRNVHPPVVKTDKDVIVKPQDVLIHRQIILPPPPPQPHIQPPRMTANRFLPPIITPIPDTAKPINHDEHIIATTGTPGTGPITDITPPTLPPGGGIEPPRDDKPLTWVSEMPKFPGGNVQDYLGKQLQYPAEEAELGIQGTVYVSFVIERDGSISNVSLLKGLSNGPDLNKEALRVISGMPKWSPGKQNGHPVRIQYMVPIHFKIQ